MAPAKVDSNPLGDRWAAMIRYDNDVSKAAEFLRPFGEAWIDKLGRDYLALGEDKKYLAPITETLINEAKLEDAAHWAEKFAQTYDGERATDEAIVTLRRAERSGYTLAVKADGTIIAARGQALAHLYSNFDIMRFGKSLCEVSK
jgi:hypothetical protein